MRSKRINLCKRERNECSYSTSFRCGEDTVQHLKGVRGYMAAHDVDYVSNSDVIRFAILMGYVYTRSLEDSE